MKRKLDVHFSVRDAIRHPIARNWFDFVEFGHNTTRTCLSTCNSTGVFATTHTVQLYNRVRVGQSQQSISPVPGTCTIEEQDWGAKMIQCTYGLYAGSSFQ